MKHVILADSAGFCFGVQRAVETVYEEATKSSQPVYTYGPIIHNEEVVKDLENKGVYSIDSVEELLQCSEKGTVIIRSHGVGSDVYQQIREMGWEIVDATCPFVIKIHKIVDEYSKKGYHIIIIGNENHPEVEGIQGWSQSDNTSIVSSKEEIDELRVEKNQKICIVSQTTFNFIKFQELVEIIEEKGYDIVVINTICHATEVRQKEAAKIAATADAMIVIGGSHSSNTQKLFEICKNECEDTYYIQTLDDLDIEKFRSIDNVGITAGASTPKKIIEEVQKNVRNEL
ncbi:MAG: 4-hydroxy-3-methylbut-2-enyl diphosphate reductase [Lachnospiraceae bacterium]